MSDPRPARLANAEETILDLHAANERLRDDLRQALRQWRMHAEMYEQNDLEHDDSAEALLYRQILARV